MRTIEISKVKVIDRQRKEIGPKKLQELKVGILSKGLLHAPVLSIEPDNTYRLRAGERRLRAMEALHAEGHAFLYDGEQIPENHIPYVLTGELSETDLFELELEENLLREDLTWMERTEAVAMLHELRSKQNPELSPAKVIKKVAEEIAAVTNNSKNHTEKEVHKSLVVMANKDNPRVKRAKSQEDAFKAILDESEQNFRAKLVLAKEKIESPHTLIHADCREAFSKISNGTVATIICDPPYGIDADKAGQESDHFYDDSAEYAMEICKFIIREGFNKCSQRAILLMFCDIDHFVTLKTYALQQAWSVHRTPIIWNKMVGGRAPWGRAGPQRSYELLLYAVKGQDEMLESAGPDIFNFKQDSKNDRTHAANKPQALLERLIRLTTLPGELVLDPCAGSGSIIPAANACKVRTICIERDETYYSQAVARLSGEPEEESPPEYGEEAFDLDAFETNEVDAELLGEPGEDQ
jgi:site-specific DNA-methyltransferase (adenine-specific)